jgi:hypothetical protein
MNEVYKTLKSTVGVPKEGPGPVSPSSPVEYSYMDQGVTDETNKMPVWKLALWNSPVGTQVGLALAAGAQIPGISDLD